MKTIIMNKSALGCSSWENAGTVEFIRLSRWISIKHNYSPCKRNALWDYVQDENGYKPYADQFNPENGLYLDYFTFDGKNYAIEQFLALGNPFFCPITYSYDTKDGKTCYLSGVDGDNYYNPLYIEFSPDCEMVRVYQAGKAENTYY